MAMEDVEKKTGLIGRFEENRSALEELNQKLEKLGGITDGQARELALEARQQVQSLILRG